MAKRFVLFIGFFAYVLFLCETDVFALSFNIITYDVGLQPQSVAVGDFDRDGKLDLAVSNSAGNNVSILLGNGDGTFHVAINYIVGNNPSSLVTEDFNRDGKLDLAVANSTGNNVSILLGNGDGSFQTAVNYTVGYNPSAVAVGNFNGDGKLDLAVANSAGNNVSILLGNGDGTFQSPEDYTVGKSPSSAAVGDFNEDGELDLAVSNSADNNVSILLNTTTTITVPGAPRKVSATAGSEQATISFSAPASDGGSPITSYTVTSSPGNITVTGTSSPITVTGLTNGTAYTFTVTATNAIGTGPASAPSNKVTPGPMISVKPTSVNLGSAGVGTVSSPKTVTIKNKGNQDLVVDSISITGDDQSEFIQTNDCSTIPAQSSCPVTVTFAPAIPFGKKSASLSISSDDPNKPTIDVKLTGQASPPKISVSPKSVKLGSVTVGDTSTPKTITIKNTGISDLLIDDISITGTDAGEFSQASSCGTIPKGGSCTIDVTFTPELAGKKSASMEISSNDPKHTVVTVNLSGEGI
jgi:hypothetical protein